MSDEIITVGSAHIDLGQAFRETAQRRIREVAAKYLGDLTGASVHVAQEGAAYRCSVTIQMGGNPLVSGEAQAHDVPLAFRTALAKAAKQLRRTKRELREDKAGRPGRITTA